MSPYVVKGDLQAQRRIDAGVLGSPPWTAATIYAVGDLARNSGALYQRATAGTSRATFDATEEAAWTRVGGGSGLPSTYTTQTAAYTAVAGDYVLANATTSGFTVTLPAAPAVGAAVAVKKTDSTANIVTITGGGATLIDGDANATIVAEDAGAIFTWDGTAWRVSGILSYPAPTTLPDAAAGARGIVQLAGDLAGTGGTATAPRVSGVQAVAVSDVDPVAGQVLQATSGTAAAWTTPTPATLTDRSTWVTGTAYAINDVVTQGGRRYVAKTAGTASAAFATDSARWVALDPVQPVDAATVTTKGDLIARDSAATVRLPVGTDGQALTASSAASTGLAWANPAVRPWSAATAYAINDVVASAGRIYRAIAAVGPVATLPAADTTNWTQIGARLSTGRTVTANTTLTAADFTVTVTGSTPVTLTIPDTGLVAGVSELVISNESTQTVAVQAPTAVILLPATGVLSIADGIAAGTMRRYLWTGTSWRQDPSTGLTSTPLSSMTLRRTTTQTGVAANGAVLFDTTTGSIAGATYNTATGTLTLPAGRRYRLTGSIERADPAGELGYQWYDTTAAAGVSSSGTTFGSSAASWGGIAVGVYAPTVTATLQLRFMKVASVTSVSSNSAGLSGVYGLVEELPGSVATVVPTGSTLGYVLGSSPNFAPTAIGDVPFNTVDTNMTVTSGTLFTLLAGRSYILDASLSFNTNSSGSGSITYQWVTAANAVVPGSNVAQVFNQVAQNTGGCAEPRSFARYTPTVNTQVKVRVLSSGGVAGGALTYGTALVQELPTATVINATTTFPYIEGTVNAGVQTPGIDSLAFFMPAAGNRSWQIASNGPTVNARVTSSFGTAGTSATVVVTSPQYMNAALNFATAGDHQRAIIRDTDTGRTYLFEGTAGPSFNNNHYVCQRIG